MLSCVIRFRSAIPLALSLGVALLAVPAQAQRDPAYAAARASGQVGEKTDGYLGVVGAGSAAVRHMVDDLNIKRKAVYAQQAQVQHATVEEYAFTAGCLAIGRTTPGEKYQTPDGTWTTRTSAPPIRDTRCP
jgi:uncharacterized protein YdbL (DUF1318 family)